ncbi:hypothetical protein [Marinobacter halophilus]|uniref:Uncharacterized protein n=2 Tax=Marinobacter TaxID=2742 RepID=A0A2T1KFM1_9GAMM|nr:hypothetical protein [Marinobacter halophilus]KPQ28980.1 MAG: hypothetical protein HLUCCX14_07895 [Marinobacter excellens HL-55]PSF08926.1 hypothetical protein C7H08_09770 [Marinobacter halophilus]
MAKKPDWSKEEQAVQAVQLAFDLSNDIQRAFRVSAALQDMSTADMVRKVLQLPYRRARARPRLTVTLKDEDFELLAQKYRLDPQDRAAIRHRVAEELQGFARNYLTDSGH